VTFKFQQIVQSWYSVQVTFVSTALCKIYLRSNLPNLFKIRPVLRKLWRNTFWCVFYAPQCSRRFYLTAQLLCSANLTSLQRTFTSTAVCNRVAPFLPRDAMLALCVLLSCVCLSVCLSHAMQYCTEIARNTITKIRPYNSPKGISILLPKIFAKFQRGHRQRERQIQVGRLELAIFDQYLAKTGLKFYEVGAKLHKVFNVVYSEVFC